MWIAYEKSDGGKGVIAVAAGMDIHSVAKKNGLADGTWMEITDAEAKELMRPGLEETRAAKLAEIMAGYDAAFLPIEKIYPAKERETWAIQLEEARAVLADPEAETPMLSIMTAARGMGETLAEFADKVMANNTAYRLLAGNLTGQQQRMYAEVTAMKDLEAIEAYVVEYTMPENAAG